MHFGLKQRSLRQRVVIVPGYYFRAGVNELSNPLEDVFGARGVLEVGDQLLVDG